LANGKIKAALFDFGETLLNFGKVDIGALFAEASRLTYDFLEQAGQPVDKRHYYYWRIIISIRLRYIFAGIIGRDFDSLALLKKIGKKRGFVLTEEQWRHLAWLWYKPLSELGRAEQNIAETLTALKKNGLKLGIISNTFINAFALDRHLSQLGLLDFFLFRIYSYRFRFRKPDKRIFQIAAEQLEENPANIIFAGDQINTDIKGALNAGMHAVLKRAYTNNQKKIPAKAYEINSLSELPRLIEKIDTEINTQYKKGACV